jgi:hypothetical protein
MPSDGNIHYQRFSLQKGRRPHLGPAAFNQPKMLSGVPY